MAGPPLGEMPWGSLEKWSHFFYHRTTPPLQAPALSRKKNTHVGVFLLLLLNRIFSSGDGKMDLGSLFLSTFWL